MTGQRVAPIEYDARAKETLDACIAYLQEAEGFLASTAAFDPKRPQ